MSDVDDALVLGVLAEEALTAVGRTLANVERAAREPWRDFALREPWRAPGVRLRRFVAIVPHARHVDGLRIPRGLVVESLTAQAAGGEPLPGVGWLHGSIDPGRCPDAFAVRHCFTTSYGEVDRWRDTRAGTILEGVTCLPVQPGWGVSPSWRTPRLRRRRFVELGPMIELSIFPSAGEAMIPGARLLEVTDG